MIKGNVRSELCSVLISFLLLSYHIPSTASNLVLRKSSFEFYRRSFLFPSASGYN